VSAPLEPLLERCADGGLRLRAPEVGWFIGCLEQGQLVTPGSALGHLSSLGRPRPLIAPEGAEGHVTSVQPERQQQPVGYGELLYELQPSQAEAPAEASPQAADGGDGLLVFRSPMAGRAWRRARPDAPPLAEVGTLLSPGQPVMLVEVMKTFTRIVYDPGERLPARARVVRVLIEDGAELEEGASLLEIEAS